jgi:hypothetical protein
MTSQTTVTMAATQTTAASKALIFRIRLSQVDGPGLR